MIGKGVKPDIEPRPQKLKTQYNFSVEYMRYVGGTKQKKSI